MSNNVSVKKWEGSDAPTEDAIKAVMTKEGVQPYRWSNGPGDHYETHTHDFHKVIYVVDGSITFKLPDDNENVKLQVGDRMDLKPGVRHEAIVGSEGVVCLEGHK